MMWNWLAGSLGVGSTLVLFDGNPLYPQPDSLWKLEGMASKIASVVMPSFLSDLPPIVSVNLPIGAKRCSLEVWFSMRTFI